MPHVNLSLTASDMDVVPKMATSHIILFSRIHNAGELKRLKGNCVDEVQIKIKHITLFTSHCISLLLIQHVCTIWHTDVTRRREKALSFILKIQCLKGKVWTENFGNWGRK